MPFGVDRAFDHHTPGYQEAVKSGGPAVAIDVEHVYAQRQRTVAVVSSHVEP